MSRDEWLDRYRDTVWVGGNRYWRGEVAYQPTWAVRDLQWRLINPLLMAWMVLFERLDDNSATDPRGKRKWVGLHIFDGFGSWNLYRQLEGVRA